MWVRSLCLLLISPGLWCHDFWIEPSSFRPAANAPLIVRLRVGQAFKGDSVPRLEALMVSFRAWGPGGDQAIVGADGADPAGALRTGNAGPMWVCYFSRPSTVELEGAKFETYLQEEGLDGISKLRARRGETSKNAKDDYVRCAKSFLTVGDTAGTHGFDHAFGLPLELLLEADPSISALLPVRLVYEGKPIKGALVTALCKDSPDRIVSTRTDAKGRVLLPLDRRGTWLLKAVHMVPGGAGQWKSYWASLTFQRD
jgi:hypothetical protein